MKGWHVCRHSPAKHGGQTTRCERVLHLDGIRTWYGRMMTKRFSIETGLIAGAVTNLILFAMSGAGMQARLAAVLLPSLWYQCRAVLQQVQSYTLVGEILS
ncbi:MAG TPA: hypothetical protein VMH23_06075 [Bacteroidota bacterium]|nr:hypothetical protein [Bacteroidota bacterium]